MRQDLLSLKDHCGQCALMILARTLCLLPSLALCGLAPTYFGSQMLPDAVSLTHDIIQPIGPRHTCETDVAVIGAGPMGLKIAHELQSRGVQIIQLDRGQVGDSIMRWFPGAVMHSAVQMITVAGVPIEECPTGACARDEYLAYLRRVCDEENLAVRTFDAVTGIARDQDGGGCFSVGTASGEEVARARYVVVAVGTLGVPKSLGPGIPGQELSHVSFKIPMDPHAYFRRAVVIVGSGASALEMASVLCRSGAVVSLVYRKPSVAEVKPEVQQELHTCVSSGALRPFPTTEVASINRTHVKLAPSGHAIRAHQVVLALGFSLNTTLLRSLGFNRDGNNLDEQPFLRVDSDTHETTRRGIFAVGLAGAITDLSAPFQTYIHDTDGSVEKVSREIRRRLGLPSPHRLSPTTIAASLGGRRIFMRHDCDRWWTHLWGRSGLGAALQMLGAVEEEDSSNSRQREDSPDAICVAVRRGSLSTCEGHLLMPAAVSVNTDVFDSTRWSSHHEIHTGAVLVFFCSRESGCSRSEARRVLGLTYGESRLVEFAEVKKADALALDGSNEVSILLFEPLARARAMSLASAVVVFQPPLQQSMAGRPPTATAVFMEAKSCLVPVSAKLVPAGSTIPARSKLLELHTVTPGDIEIVTDEHLAQTILSVLVTHIDRSCVRGKNSPRRKRFVDALRTAERVADQSNIDQLVNCLHTAFKECAACALPSTEELWGNGREEDLAVIHTSNHEKYGISGDSGHGNGCVANLRMYQGLQNRNNLLQLTERLIHAEAKSPCRVLNVGVDLYTIQYEYLAKEWSPGAVWMSIELDPNRAALYGSRSGSTFTLDVMDLAQSPLIKSDSIDIMVCFGIIEPQPYIMIPDGEFEALLQGVLRGAEDVLRNGGQLVLHVSRKPRADELEASFSRRFPSSNLVIVGRPFEDLFVLQKKSLLATEEKDVGACTAEERSYIW